MPKEMLPLFCKDLDDKISLKPILQLIFEQLYSLGFRDFCFIVGRGKRGIEDHFTPDHEFIQQLNSKGRNKIAFNLEAFYDMVETSTIIWVNQPEPKGFGHAVLQAKTFIGNEPSLVCAGDTYIISKNGDHIKRLVKAHFRYKADATLLLQQMESPRGYGIAEVEKVEDGVLNVKNVVEKPDKPPSNLAIMPIYIFTPTIMKALEKTQPGFGGEIQLTDGIQKLIGTNRKVYAVKMREDEIRLDIGTPQTYWEALSLSYKYFKGKPNVKPHHKK